ADRAGGRRPRRQRRSEDGAVAGDREKSPGSGGAPAPPWCVGAELAPPGPSKLRPYRLSIVTDSIVIGLSGRSPGLLVGTFPILLMTSMPSVTSPKTLCLSSSQGVGTRVMKNWPPL